MTEAQTNAQSDFRQWLHVSDMPVGGADPRTLLVTVARRAFVVEENQSPTAFRIAQALQELLREEHA